jgi:hypothetical protein
MLTKTQKVTLNSLIKQEVETILEHFKKDKWDLNVSFISDCIKQQAIGDVTAQLILAVIKADKKKEITCVLKDNQLVFRYKKPKKKKRV